MFQVSLIHILYFSILEIHTLQIYKLEHHLSITKTITSLQVDKPSSKTIKKSEFSAIYRQGDDDNVLIHEWRISTKDTTLL